jgi:hypothetical protein
MAVCLLLILSLAACGQDPKEEAYERLQNQVASIRDAAEAGEANTAVQRLTSLRTNVAEMRADDVITEAETQRILTAALQVQANLPLIMPPPPPAPAPPAVAPPPAPSGNAGGSIRGNDGEKGQKGQKGENGKRGDEDD